MIEIYRDSMDYYGFRVRAKNNYIIANSENIYATKKGCINGVRSLLDNIGLPSSKINRIITNVKNNIKEI